ncbi:glycosyltransferase family 9 protein [Sulfurirhabdus autotrophica]|uniref:ADP-heptose:LPS heptosyltransferase n=1 Tax=Sulfurirhabdus autotrophica TaxID=1706046 RepID=A0A4R3Y2L1_9PROT|nr:glycosyltransferase family 9 protein [Sulfurirhabdus autotrophica]TCV84283.1 ADP-heptose:LPS heptosyltransferase [Sulfurirhabdus autotrophica]
MSTSLKILVIRRDNIGDLVCTTPMFLALRAHFPKAYIAALVNSYNLPVLQNNPDIDDVFAYTKAKHRAKGQSTLRVYWDRIRLIFKLRKQHFDYVILAAPDFQPRSLKLARMVRPKHIIGFVSHSQTEQHIEIDTPIPYIFQEDIHEAEDVFNLLTPLGILPPPPQLRITPPPVETDQAQSLLKNQQWLSETKMLIGIHISARKPSQRWPSAYFVELISELHTRHQSGFILLWSPGDETNPMHPGDDTKAQEIRAQLNSLPILAYPTSKLEELIAALSLCDSVICSDGGAMHLAAGLGKPILCFFGKSNQKRWHPWGVPYIALQPESFNVEDISPDIALKQFDALLQKSNL